MLSVESKMIERNDIDYIMDSIIKRGDERYVMISNCSERQEAINKKFANDDKRIDRIINRVAIWEKLLWAIASASIGALVLSFFELILK